MKFPEATRVAKAEMAWGRPLLGTKKNTIPAGSYCNKQAEQARLVFQSVTASGVQLTPSSVGCRMLGSKPGRK
jgi:hypothetical protein